VGGYHQIPQCQLASVFRRRHFNQARRITAASKLALAGAAQADEGLARVLTERAEELALQWLKAETSFEALARFLNEAQIEVILEVGDLT